MKKVKELATESGVEEGTAAFAPQAQVAGMLMQDFDRQLAKQREVMGC